MSAYINNRAREDIALDDFFEMRMFRKLMEGKKLTKDELDEVWREKEEYSKPIDEREADDAGQPIRGEL